jgi:alkyl sulfatase BDS1-like metallo-beta-lactamase superfamily hydrolase
MRKISIRVRTIALVALCVCLEAGCSRGRPPQIPPASGSPGAAASAATVAANRKVAEELPLADPQDFEDARRGFIATDNPLVIKGPDGRNAWDMSA